MQLSVFAPAEDDLVDQCCTAGSPCGTQGIFTGGQLPLQRFQQRQKS
jgi:hypothetical protein